jgi:hypothetical protein
MRRLTLCFLLASLAPLIGDADNADLPTGYRSILQDSARFREIRFVTALPVEIVALCADPHDRLADPGEKWQATDVIETPHLPRKRLIWAETDGVHYVVHYEMGGIGHSFHVMVATLIHGETKPKDVWFGAGGPFRNYSWFLDGLQNGEVDNRKDYYH